MAVWKVKSNLELASNFVLAPERYDPRRELQSPGLAGSTTTTLNSIAKVVRQTITPAAAETGSYLVLDTSNAQQGIIVRPSQTVNAKQIGSAKKIVEAKDVIISRLRPYLRQVAFIDDDLWSGKKGGLVICSTEFFVLRSIDDRSIAFLVPFLLSAPVQKVLAAAQEGGHHPRFIESTLTSLSIPERIVETRNKISQEVEESIRHYRQCEVSLAQLVADCSIAFQQG